MYIATIRGATCVKENTKEDILKYTEELLLKILEKNNITIEEIIAIVFTATTDLDAEYPAVSARKLGITEASIMCMQEMNVIGSMKKCIRVMIVVNNEDIQNSQKNVRHIYLHEAAKLRPDLMEEKKCSQ